MYFKKYRFAPKWYFSVITLCLCTLFIYLGHWQLQRATEKQNLQTAFTARLRMAPLSLTQLSKNSDILYYPLKVAGHYDNAHTLFLDNKIHAHRVGYEVLTPLIINGDSHRLLINRGWVPADNDRRVLPVVPDINTEETIVGFIYVPSTKTFTLGRSVEVAKSWPMRVQSVNINGLENIWQQPVYPFILLLSADDKNGFVRDWQPVASPPERHWGYAMQWFAFAGVLMIIFIVLNLRKRE